MESYLETCGEVVAEDNSLPILVNADSKSPRRSIFEILMVGNSVSNDGMSGKSDFAWFVEPAEGRCPRLPCVCLNSDFWLDGGKFAFAWSAVPAEGRGSRLFCVCLNFEL